MLTYIQKKTRSSKCAQNLFPKLLEITKKCLFMILCQSINLCFVIPSPSSNFETHRHICSFFTNKKNAFCAICLSSRFDEAYYTQVSLL